MVNVIKKISLDKLTPHPDNPNKMSEANFAKLVRNIERTDRYEPLIVRPITDLQGFGDAERVRASPCSESQCASVFQIINGHHRWLALKELGKKTADVIVWDVDDKQTDILLASLNRLCGQDALDKKIALLKRLNEKMQPAELAKLLPQTKGQLEKLINLDSQRVSLVRRGFSEGGNFANPLVFFVSDGQQQVIETALVYALQNENSLGDKDDTKATKRASALSAICRYYLDRRNDGRETIDE